MHLLLLLSAFCAAVSAQFSDSGKAGIVDAHNALRSKIAKGTYVAKGTTKPAGSNIRKMKWDDTVAASAQAYANTCPTGHSGASGLGENLYWSWSSGAIGGLDVYGTDACKWWENEFQEFGWTTNLFDMDLFNSGIAHATQMAWHSTYLIGCGVKNCGLDASNNMNKVSVVCQYKPQGNWLDDNVYESGSACSACPSGTSCESSTGLCV